MTLADVKAYFTDPQVVLAGSHQTTDAENGRLETRHHAVVHDVAWLLPTRSDPDRPAMPRLGTIARVEAEVERDDKRSRSTHYYLFSARLSTERFAEAVRAHWGIENGVYWVLDTVFDEDQARNQRTWSREPRHPAQTRSQCP